MSNTKKKTISKSDPLAGIAGLNPSLPVGKIPGTDNVPLIVGPPYDYPERVSTGQIRLCESYSQSDIQTATSNANYVILTVGTTPMILKEFKLSGATLALTGITIPLSVELRITRRTYGIVFSHLFYVTGANDHGEICGNPDVVLLEGDSVALYVRCTFATGGTYCNANVLLQPFN